MGLGDLLHDRQPEPGAGHPARGRASGRSGRTRTAGPRRRCRGRGRAPMTSPSCTATSTCPPGGLHLAALSSRFATARSIVDGTPWTSDSSRSVSNSTLGPVAPRALDRVGREQVEPHVLGGSTRRVAGLARELDQLGDQRGHLVELLDHVASSCSRSSGASSFARARTSMFVRRLVSGVRSSCEASATSCRCARLELLERREHRVEARREPAELVVAGRGRLDPLREVARLGDVLASSRSAAAPARARRARRAGRARRRRRSRRPRSGSGRA